MGHIYRNVGPLDIPPEGRVNHHDDRVYVKCVNKKGRPGYRKIGEVAAPGKMYPNDYFRFKYPDLWEAATGVRPPPYELRIGLYLVYLAIAQQTGLYDALINSFDVTLANAVMDYAMVNAIDRSDATYILAEDMKGDLLFSPRPHIDEWYSKQFETMGDAQIWKFKQEWIKTLSMKGHESTWLCVDSSNSDCHRKNSNLCRLGHSKSKSGSPVVGYIWAVEADNGIPVTWVVNPGSMVDFKAVDEIVKFLSANSMKARGLIFDRGFCGLKVLKLARKKHYEYVAMLKDNTIGYRTMFDNHADELRWKVDKKLPGVAIFGTVDKTKVFEECDWDDWIGLYWDGPNANERALTLANQVEALKIRLEAGLEKEAKGHLKDFFTIGEENGSIQVSINYENLQKAVDSKGFSAIASSVRMDAAAIRKTYYLRDNSEKGFSFVKPQLGYDSARVHSDGSVKGKFAVAFVSTVLRTYLETACKKLGLATNAVIRELNSIVLHMGRDNLYEAIHNASGKILTLLKSFGVTPAMMEALAVEVNNGARLEDERRKMPVELAALTVKEGRGRPRKIKTEPEAPKRPRGRPKGSKNKKTLEKEALMASMPQAIKRKPGRPKGSKNKKTLEREALEAKPKRGRPKGSKNKTPEEKAALMNAPRRPRGRPRKNKVDDSEAMQNPQSLTTDTEPAKTDDKNPTVPPPPSEPYIKIEDPTESTVDIKLDKDSGGNPHDTS